MRVRRAHAYFLFAVLLLILSGVSGSGDWVLVINRHGVDTGICAKSQATCEAAREAIAKGWWSIVPPVTPTVCLPHPRCFAE